MFRAGVIAPDRSRGPADGGYPSPRAAAELHGDDWWVSANTVAVSIYQHGMGH